MNREMAIAAAETAYWNPAIVTDKDGHATITFTLPERSTAWRLLAKGITADTLAGEATESLTANKDLFGGLKLPPSFTDGDQAEVVASIHNDAVEKGPIQVTLRTTIGDRTVEEQKTVEVQAKGIRDVTFNVGTRGEGRGAGDTVDFVLTVAAAGRHDVVRRSVPLLPYGLPVYATAAGVAASDTSAWVEPPSGMSPADPTLSILVGPTVERSLLDVLLAPPPPCQFEVGRIASDVETATSDLMAAIGLQRLLIANRQTMPEVQELDARIRAGVSLLGAAQNDDGGWSWTGRGGRSDRYATSRAVWALCLARKAGYHVPEEQFHAAVALLQNELVATAKGDYETKAILLHALATVGKADFAVANRLYRQRQRLSAGALVYLSLALAEMDRKPTAGELLDWLNCGAGVSPAHAADHRSAAVPAAALQTLPWCQSPAELRALWALAAQAVSPQSAKAKEQVDWLLAHRVGHRWSPDKATGPATLALAQWFARSRFEGEKYTLAVFVNDVPVKRLEVDPAAGTQSIDVNRAMLKKGGRQRISFQITGRGRYAYQCILGGFVPAEKLRGTTRDWQVKRTFEPAPLELDGRDVPRGFSVLQGTYAEFKNPLTQLPVGRRGLVEIDIQRKDLPDNVSVEQLEYLVDYRTDPRRGNRHRTDGPRRVRAVRGLAGHDHVLRGQSPPRGADPL